MKLNSVQPIEQFNNQSMSAPGVPAPAVGTAIRILDYLAKQHPRAGVTDIARALGVSKSSCFNILATLSQFGMLSKLPGGAQYQLGPRLAALAGAARRQYSYREVLQRHFGDLAAETHLVCVVGQPLGDDTSFVIIDQIVPPGFRLRNLAPRVGTVVPLSGPALGRALLSGMDDLEALQIIRHMIPNFSMADETEFKRELREVRERGYAVSLERYQKGINAVAVAIEKAGEPYLVVGLVGDSTDFTVERIHQLGPNLAERARALRSAISDTPYLMVAT